MYMGVQKRIIMGKIKDTLRQVVTYIKELINLSAHIDTVAAEANIRYNIPFRGPNVIILFCAIVIASLGLNVNSIPVIIGAMLISPLMGPIIGFGLSLGINDMELFKKSLKNLGVMVAISLFASTLYFLASPLDMEHPTELLARTNPTIYDVMIAFFGGVAGTIEVARKEKGTVISGVAIATALMPPLCTVGYGLAQWNWEYILGALYLFCINSLFIALATYIMVKQMKFASIEIDDTKQNKRRKQMIALAIFIVIVPSVISGYSIVMENNFNRSVNRFIAENKSIGKSYVYDSKIDNTKKPAVITLYMAGERLTDTERENIYERAEKYGFLHSQIAFNEDAVNTFVPINQEALVQDIFANNEKQIREREARIQQLEAQIAAYEAAELPAVQLAKELTAQYPTVKHVVFARGKTVDATTAEEKPQIVVILTCEPKKHLTTDELTQIRAWLPIRLGQDNVDVITK